MAKAKAKIEAKPEAKAKPKKSRKPGNQGFLLLHVEKLVLGIVVLASLYLAYSGLTGYKPLAWEPQELVQAASQAEDHIKNSTVTPREFDEKLFTVNYDEKATWIKKDISQVAFATDKKWEPTLFPDKIKRDVPTIFPVESLRAIPGNGPILVIDRDPRRTTGAGRMGGMGGGMGGPMGMDSSMGGSGMGGVGSGTKLEARKWIVLTGLIPIKKQLTEYLNKFSDSMFTNPMIDTPQFLAYEIERCEYDPTNATPNWQKIDAVLQYTTELNEWAGMGTEQVDRSYLAPMMPGTVPMAYPLPPMVQRLFGEEIAYPPYIPLLADSLIESMEKQEEELKNLKDFKPVNLDDLIRQQSQMGLTGASMGGSGMSGMGGSGMGGPGMSGMGGPGMSGMGGPGMSGMGGPGMSGMGGPGMSGMGGPGMAGMSTGRSGVNPTGIYARGNVREYVPPPLVDHYLFRFFDFNIEDEKSYEYRVRLIVKNPNFKLDSKYLEDESSNQAAVLSSVFSASSRPMSTGRMSRVLVKDVTAPVPRRASQETSIKLLPIYFDMDDASEWVSNDDKLVFPGMVANFKSTSTYKAGATRNSSTAMGPRPTGGSAPGTSPSGIRQETKTVDVVSDIAFLGAYGGFPVEGNSRSPAKVLLMDANGTVVLRNLGTDLDESEKYSKTATQNQRGASGMGPGMGSGMGY